MRKIVLNTIDFPMFNDCHITWFVCNDIERTKQFFREKGITKDWECYGNGFTWNRTVGMPVVWMRSKRVDIVVHEMIHAVMNIFEYLDTKMCQDTEEIFAYMVDYSVSKVLK